VEQLFCSSYEFGALLSGSVGLRHVRV
jgi:hypothetical protein